MAAPLVYPPNSIFEWTSLEYACRSVLLPFREAILNLGTEPPASDEPDAIRAILTPNTDSADISQFPKEKLERVQEFGKYSIEFLKALGPYLNENWSGFTSGLGSVVQKVEHVYLAVDNYLRSPEGSDCRRRATIDMCTAGRLCFAIRVSFPGMLNGISRRHDFIAYCELLNCPPNISNPETLKAINIAGATWKAETCWRKRLRALANKITTESKYGSPELSVSNLDYYSKLADPILGKAIALGELNDESGLLKQLAIKAGDDADKPRPNRPHLSLFDKLAPQLFPGVSFDKSQEYAPLVLAATLERMADVGTEMLGAPSNTPKLGDGAPLGQQNAILSDKSKKPTRKKRSTNNGDATAKLITALTTWHEYYNGSCLKTEPVGSNQLGRLADVDKSTASVFFEKKFDGHDKYMKVCRRPSDIAQALKILNGEYAPNEHLYGGTPPSDRERFKISDEE